MTEQPLVHVVVPVYNGEEFLAECLQSIRKQTYANWRCSVIDNASTDRTPEIAADHARDDERIEHQRHDDFVTATENHNRAFAAVDASSEFCKVVQADDWLYADCLRIMVELGRAHPTAGIVSAYQLWERKVHLTGIPYDTEFLPGREVVRATLRGDYNVTGGPTAHMLRSRCVRERAPFYEAGLRHQDTEAALWILMRHDLAFAHQVLTFARNQAGARSGWSTEMRSDRAEDVVFILRYGPEVMSPDEFRDRLRFRLWRYVRWHARQAASPARLRDEEFFGFHEQKCRQIVAAADGNRDALAAVRTVRLLLARGVLARIGRGRGGRGDWSD
jgi:glycosyltransferase involved in cell wall biosynthesis